MYCVFMGMCVYERYENREPESEKEQEGQMHSN